MAQHRFHSSQFEIDADGEEFLRWNLLPRVRDQADIQVGRHPSWINVEKDSFGQFLPKNTLPVNTDILSEIRCLPTPDDHLSSWNDDDDIGDKFAIKWRYVWLFNCVRNVELGKKCWENGSWVRNGVNNARDLRRLEFARSHWQTMVNTCHRHQMPRTVTWPSPYGLVHSRIDFILSHQNVKICINWAKTRTLSGANIGSKYDL